MKIAVTTANGHLGSAIIRHLIAEIGQENVVGIARTPSKATHLGIEIRKGDYNVYDDFEKALQGMDGVLIVSGNDTPDKRIPQHRNIIEAAKANQLKKIVYTSIQGDASKTAFSPIIQSNRQTEADVRNSGLSWVIGQNNIYIEPDLEHIHHYEKSGEISNSAQEGKCGYTSRDELAFAYTKMLLEDKHLGNTYALSGNAITQSALAQFINQVYGTQLTYRSMSVEAYTAERKKQLGEFLGTVIGGIYEGIHNGAFALPSAYEKAAGRPHKPTLQLIQEFKHQQQS